MCGHLIKSAAVIDHFNGAGEGRGGGGAGDKEAELSYLTPNIS